MEDNENKPEKTVAEEIVRAEEVNKGNAPLSREEILEISRKENKNGDEREKQSLEKANSFGFSTGLLLAGIIMIVTVFVNERFPAEIYLIVSGMQAVQSFVVAHGYRKMRKVYLTVGIIEAVCSVFFLVFWILQLCGVV